MTTGAPKRIVFGLSFSAVRWDVRGRGSARAAAPAHPGPAVVVLASVLHRGRAAILDAGACEDRAATVKNLRPALKPGVLLSPLLSAGHSRAAPSSGGGHLCEWFSFKIQPL